MSTPSEPTVHSSEPAGESTAGDGPSSREGSLARRILWAMVLVAVVPLIIMAGQGLHCAHQAVVELEYAHLQSILAARKIQLESWLEERENDLKFSCFLSCGDPACAGMVSHMAPEHVLAMKEKLNLSEPRKSPYESLAGYDGQWNRIDDQPGTTHRAPQSLLDEELKGQLMTATGIVASATHPHSDGHFGVHMGYPLRDADGELKGSIVVNMDLGETLNSILRDRTGLGVSGKIYLVSEDGSYLSNPSDNLVLVGERAKLPEDILNPGTQGVISYPDAKGADVLGLSVRVPRFGWILVAEEDKAEALAWLGVLRYRALITGLVTLICVLVLASRYADKLADPLRALAATARRITGGAHQERVGDLRGSEAREVAHAFNEMLDSLSDAQQEVVRTASLAAIGELSSSVVHEMRNPLSSVKLNLLALRKKVEGDGNYEELADIAVSQALRLERMLSELLQFGKPVTLSLSAMRFGELAEEATSGLLASAEGKSIEFRIRDELDDRQLQVDREHIRRAIENLVANALEAGPEGGEVAIEARVSEHPHGFAEISIRDQGPGIAPALLDRLFQPFITTKENGTGLGLANVKKIVELHEGSVRAENPAGGGALFTIRIPLSIDPA